MNKILKSGAMLIIAFVIVFPTQASVAINSQNVENLAVGEIVSQSDTQKKLTVSAWLGGGFQSGAWQELLDKTPKSNQWDKKSGTSKYWSMYNQYFCHADWAGGFKAPWNLEPARPNVGYLKTVVALCNPS